jgi:phage-related protein
MTWTVAFYSSSLEDELLNLPPGLLAKFLRYAERLESFGPHLGMPHTRAMGSGLVELRVKAAEGIVRVFFCTAVGHRIVLLHQFHKKTDRTPSRELEIARRRMREIMG